MHNSAIELILIFNFILEILDITVLIYTGRYVWTQIPFRLRLSNANIIWVAIEQCQHYIGRYLVMPVFYRLLFSDASIFGSQ